MIHVRGGVVYDRDAVGVEVVGASRRFVFFVTGGWTIVGAVLEADALEGPWWSVPPGDRVAASAGAGCLVSSASEIDPLANIAPAGGAAVREGPPLSDSPQAVDFEVGGSMKLTESHEHSIDLVKLPDARWPEGEAPVILERIIERRRQILLEHRTARWRAASVIDRAMMERARFDLLARVRWRHHAALSEKVCANWPIEETGRVLDRENWEKDW